MAGVSAVAGTVLWWVTLWGIWLLALSTAPPVEFMAAAAAGLLCALLVPLVRRITGVSWHARWRWLVWLAALPVTALTETVAVLSLPLRDRDAGSWQRVPLAEEDSERRSTGQRAAAAFVLSATPGTFVVDSPPDEPLLVHVLASGHPRLDRLVST